MVVLNDGRVWKRHVDHMRRDSMDRAVSDPSRELESQDKPPDIPLAIPSSVCIPSPSHIGMCRCEGYGFQAVYSSIGYINQSVWV